jgi:ubiquinone biosynthesis protein
MTLRSDGRATIRRIAWVLIVLGRYGIVLLFTAVCRGQAIRRLGWNRRLRGKTPPERVRDLFQDLGGTFLKFGQMLALQPDILPIEFCNALFDLLDRVPPFPFDDVERIFIEDLGRPAIDLFDSIEISPVASASIGQVHAATLAGRKVAVKVQRPTARVQFTSDIRLMSLAIRLIRRLRLRRVYWLIEPMTEFVLWTSEELDYRVEARYMERLRRNAATNARERVPAVLWPYVTHRILVSEFLDGETVLGYLRRRESTPAVVADAHGPEAFNPHALASNIIDNFLGDVFQHGIFHADLHPANLVIMPGDVVGYVDFGITGTISRFSRQNLIAMTLAYTRADLTGMCDAFFRVCALDARSTIEAFRSGVERASYDWYGSGTAGPRLRKNFTRVMLDMLRLSRECGVWPEREVIKYIRSAIAIDGLITRLAPAFDVRGHLERVCARYVAGHSPYSTAISEAIAAWASVGARLFRTGGARTATILQRISAGGFPMRLELERPVRRAASSRGAVAAACFIAGAAAMVGLPANVDAGAATAELSMIACLVALLVRGSRRFERTRTGA